MATLRGDFTKEDPWRIFRIMSEFVDGFEELSDVGDAVTIFGSARASRTYKYYKMAEETAVKLVHNGYAVITGAGPGIMEAANKGAKKVHGNSIGLNILIPTQQKPNRFVTKTLDFNYFFCRKVMFVKYAKALVIFPGGFGTLDEFFEVITLVQTRRMDPMPVILVGSDFWGGMVNWIKKMLLPNNMIDSSDIHIFDLVDSPQEIADVINRFYKK